MMPWIVLYVLGFAIAVPLIARSYYAEYSTTREVATVCGLGFGLLWPLVVVAVTAVWLVRVLARLILEEADRD